MRTVPAAAQGQAETACWQRIEFTLTAEREHLDPEAVPVRAEFTGPGGRRIVLPAWWNGASEWRVRFAPTAVGRWRYRITCAGNDDPGLHGICGTVTATAYDGDLAVYRHGFPRISDDARGFVYADGTPFFWLGDTHWQAPNYERLHESNHPLGHEPSQFIVSVRTMARQGFTVYQTYPDAGVNDGGGNLSQVDWWARRYDRLNPASFSAQFDPMMEELAGRGLVIALGMGAHWVNGRLGADAMTRFTRAVVARYACYPVVWITGQEVDVEQGLNTLPVWREVAETIAETDGYHHPLAAHMDSVGEPMTFGDQPWHDWFATQGGHGRLRSKHHYAAYWNRRPAKPFLETEANYEGILDVRPGAARRSAWRALQCGSRGFTYGGAGTWALKWDRDVPGWDEFQNGIPWYEGLDLPERAQMGLLRTFYESLADWHCLQPQFDDETRGAFTEPESALLSTDGNRTYVVYFSGPGVETGELRALDPSVTYRARWFDPRKGNWREIPEEVPGAGTTWQIPAKPDTQDWALVVDQEFRTSSRTPKTSRTASR